ncbi:hypothetical protein [Salininema proteolyticum]|uniref:Uncharacterized protein n=1 Tax=Salininema proteolyticum TaxID=1607685 RepID=A0ABV8U305_9ACTN
MDVIDANSTLVAVVAGVSLVLALALAAFSSIALGKVRASEKWPTATPPPVGHNLALTATVAALVVIAFSAGALSLVYLATASGMTARVLIALGAALFSLIAGAVVINLVAGRHEMRALTDIPEIEPQAAPPPLPVSADPSPYQIPDNIARPVDNGGDNYEAFSERSLGLGEYASGAPAFEATPPGPRTGEFPAYTSQPQYGGAPSAQATRQTVPTIPTDTQPGWVFRDRSTGAYYAAVKQSRGGVSLLALSDFTVARTAALVGPLDLVGSVETSVWPMEREEED